MNVEMDHPDKPGDDIEVISLFQIYGTGLKRTPILS